MESTPPTKQPKRNPHTWLKLLNLTIFSAYFYAFMEWLFFATKPSFLSTLAPLEVAKVLVVTGGIVVLPPLGALGILSLLARLTGESQWRSRLLTLGKIVPALVLAVTALILFDNFTYTVFHFGIVTTVGIWRGLYALGFGIALWQAFRFVQRRLHKRWKKSASFLALGLLAVSMIAILLTGLTRDSGLGDFSTRYRVSAMDRPNIIILGSDGLSASKLSAYGYTTDTTPFLSQMIKTSLVAENAFPNASSTTASTASALTGREPMTVKVYRYPDILSGQDSFEHLPGILKQYGYYAVELGTPYYVDAQKLNLLDSFDMINNQSINVPLLGVFRTVLGNSPSTYFTWTILERASERIQHIFFIKQMRNPLEEVNDPNARMTDDEKVDQIIDLLNKADRPVFVFTHLMDTHGPAFSSSKQAHTSDASVDENTPWNINLYEASIGDFDNHVEKIYNYLSQSGKLDNTILVIYTDHGYKYSVNQRIPIIIHFPNNEYTGTRSNNVQIIDIPVTLLDYLGLPKPAWMSGQSLLEGEPPATRNIISIVAGSPKKIAPPFFQIKSVQIIVCQKWYALNVQENKFTSGNIFQHTTQCEKNLLPSDSDVRQEILDTLESYGYDISSLTE